MTPLPRHLRCSGHRHQPDPAPPSSCWKCDLRETLWASLQSPCPACNGTQLLSALGYPKDAQCPLCTGATPAMINGTRPEAYSLSCVAYSLHAYILDSSLPRDRAPALVRASWGVVKFHRKLLAKGLLKQ